MIEIPKSEFATLDEYVENLRHNSVKFRTDPIAYLGGLAVITEGKTVIYDASGYYAGRIIRGDISP